MVPLVATDKLEELDEVHAHLVLLEWSFEGPNAVWQLGVPPMAYNGLEPPGQAGQSLPRSGWDATASAGGSTVALPPSKLLARPSKTFHGLSSLDATS